MSHRTARSAAAVAAARHINLLAATIAAVAATFIAPTRVVHHQLHVIIRPIKVCLVHRVMLEDQKLDLCDSWKP